MTAHTAAARQLVVIGCGAGKLDRSAPAAELYTGAYFRCCLTTALALAPRHDVLILSAKHGLVGLDDWLAPYDLTIGQPGAVDAWHVRDQAARRRQLDRDVLALCSARYADMLRSVFARVDAPLAGLGIGRQRHALAELRSAALGQANADRLW